MKTIDEEERPSYTVAHKDRRNMALKGKYKQEETKGTLIKLLINKTMCKDGTHDAQICPELTSPLMSERYNP